MRDKKKNNNNEKLVTTKKKNIKELVISMGVTACVCVAVGGLVGSLITSNMLKGKDKDKDENSEPTMTTVALTKDSEINSAIEEIDNVIDYVMSKPVYIEVQVSDNSFDRYLYNSKGEAAVQSSNVSYTVVFTNDGNSVRCNQLDEQLEKNTSIDVITNVSSAIDGIKNKKDGFSMSQIVADGDDEKVKEYVIETKGLEACKEVYRVVSDEYADTIMDTLVEYISEMEGIKYDPTIRYGFIFADDNSLNMYCEIMVNGVSNINWYCTGYIHTDDWELDKAWYETEFVESNTQKIMDMAADLSKELGDVLHKAVEKENSISESVSEAEGSSTGSSTVSEEGTTDNNESASSDKSDTITSVSETSNEDSGADVFTSSAE